ncbi:MAG: ABC transporter ATP-binding protein [Eubacterium sp.]|nr:ABC transporter ATP-binding protein [Eubacterium sp.]
MKNLFGNLKNYKLQVFIIFLFLMLQAFCDLALPRYTQDVIDVGIINHGFEGAIPENVTQAEINSTQTEYLWSMGGKMLIMAFIMFLASAVVAYMASKIGADIGKDLRSRVFGRVMRYSSAEMDQFSTASLITRCTNDVQQVQLVMTMILRMVLYAPVMGVWGVVNVAATGSGMEWIIVLAVLTVIGLVAVMMSVTIPRFRKMQELVDALNRVAREILTGLPVIRAFGSEKMEEARFDKANRDLTDTQLFTTRIMTMMQPGMMLIMNGLIVAITWTAAHRIDDGVMQVGQMTAFITYSMMIVISFLMMSIMSILLPRAGVAADRIQEILDTKSSIVEKEEPEKMLKRGGEVVFSSVSFCYPGAEENALYDISFTAEPGKTTAIIGSTGCGKSTLVNLIPRFYDVTSGSISVNGTDIRDLSLEELRKAVGFVPQKGVLFSGTIADNIRFGDEEAADEDIREAADIAQASGFIDEDDEGMDRPVSQGGSNVSGGQKQRLAIARAIAKKPDLLVFDDSFSALDMKTDAALRKALEEKLRGVTKIIVAQRISTIVHADQIIVLDDGRISGRGTHRELMKTCEVYREIAESQLSVKELSELAEGGEV